VPPRQRRSDAGDATSPKPLAPPGTADLVGCPILCGRRPVMECVFSLVVGIHLESGDSVHLEPASGQEDHRGVAHPQQLLEHLTAVVLTEPDVEEHQSGSFADTSTSAPAPSEAVEIS
jgi:hypothetical protein